MSINLLWKENRNHIRLNIPDTVYIKEGKISDWYFTSTNGLLKKHKPENWSVSKLTSTFEENLQGEDPPVAVTYSLEGLGSKTLLCSHFDVMLMHLNNGSLPSEDLILQKYISPKDSKTVFTSYEDGNISFWAQNFAEKYLVNGIYPLEQKEVDLEIPSTDQKTLAELVQKVNLYLSDFFGSIHCLTAEWIKDSNDNFCLVNLFNVKEQVSIAGKRDTRNISACKRVILNSRDSSSRRQRPPSAPKNARGRVPVENLKRTRKSSITSKTSRLRFQNLDSSFDIKAQLGRRRNSFSKRNQCEQSSLNNT